jgi:hypothetical protein
MDLMETGWPTPQQWREQIESGRLVVPQTVERGLAFVAAEQLEGDHSGWAAAVVGIEHG